MTASTPFLFFDMWLAFSNLYFEKYKFWTYFFITVGVIILFLIGAALGCWLNSEERKIYKSNKMIKKYKTN